MSSASLDRARRDEAMRDYLDLCKHWVYELYSNHGVRVNELHRALVHYREPWVDATRLRSAIVRWTKKDEPGPWPLEQTPRRPGFTIPPPPIAPPHLLSRLRVTEPVPNDGLSSMPITNPPNHRNQEMLHHASPLSPMPNSMTSPGMPMLFNQAPGTFSPDHGQQWQQTSQASAINSTIQSQSEVTLPTPNQSHSSPVGNADAAENNSMDDDAGHGPVGSICPQCNNEIGLFCACAPVCI
ncbi:hypothetical protein L207DRAFT_574977 [Hyaloscypha variabilis F]|uniref:Uncharacterized protein n=1 Tax=Hyaloscypha variabilis (strain UAMH 11265 / GT02V1 / F) TaxID=1149755 RepID=A0A2J6SC27_HYAVF|nr:hypothetical protein L207DRAFT_574977 [Hyaloscypha variabilis F]